MGRTVDVRRTILAAIIPVLVEIGFFTILSLTSRGSSAPTTEGPGGFSPLLFLVVGIPLLGMALLPLAGTSWLTFAWLPPEGRRLRAFAGYAVIVPIVLVLGLASPTWWVGLLPLPLIVTVPLSTAGLARWWWSPAVLAVWVAALLFGPVG